MLSWNNIRSFWENKFKANINRDNLNQANLLLRGWKIIIIWECQLKGDIKKLIRELIPN